MGTLEKFLKQRVKTPTPGKWSSGFTACKKYADQNKMPLIGMWTNGDQCGLCIETETALMHKTFIKWMADSNCIFWLGCCDDTSKDDKEYGTGYNWAWKNQTLRWYPFVRIWWKEGKVDQAMSGDTLCGDSSKGYNVAISKLKKLLKKYLEKPVPIPDPGDEDAGGGSEDEPAPDPTPPEPTPPEPSPDPGPDPVPPTPEPEPEPPSDQRLEELKYRLYMLEAMVADYRKMIEQLEGAT